MVLPAVWLTACSSHSAPQKLSRADAAPLAALATRISHEGACAQRRDIGVLQARAVNLVNTGRVPQDLQDTLMSGVNALAEDTPPCVPAVPVQATTTAPPVPTPPAHHPKPRPKPKPPKPHDHHHGHGKHH